MPRATEADPRRRAAERGGRRAEFIAAWFLRLKLYRVIARRYRTPVGEIDLIVRRGRTIAFVEVKQRPSEGEGLEAVAPVGRAADRAGRRLLARRPSRRGRPRPPLRHRGRDPRTTPAPPRLGLRRRGPAVVISRAATVPSALLPFEAPRFTHPVHPRQLRLAVKKRAPPLPDGERTARLAPRSGA